MLLVVHIYIDRSEAETWNHDEIDNLQGKINTGEYSMSKVIIIGGGAAGMMAGVFAARNHHEVHILLSVTACANHNSNGIQYLFIIFINFSGSIGTVVFFLPYFSKIFCTFSLSSFLT